MGKSFKVKKEKYPKKKKRLGGIEADLISGKVQIGGAGRHADKRKSGKYKEQWHES